MSMCDTVPRVFKTVNLWYYAKILCESVILCKGCWDSVWICDSMPRVLWHCVNIVAVAEFLWKLIFGDLLIFVVSGQRKHAASIGTIHFFIGYLENAKYPPDENCLSCSSYKIAWKIAYLGLKMTLLNQKHEIIMKVAYLSVLKLGISFKDMKLSEKLPILV